MLLQLLRDYAQRQKLPPSLYSERPVRYWIELDGAGRPRSPEPQDSADTGSRAQRRGKVQPMPYVQRTSTTRPLLFADTAEYTFGFVADPGDTKRAKRAAQRHAAYLELTADCDKSTQEPAVGAVRSFLESDPLDQLKLGDDFDASATITFRVDGTPVVDLPAVQAFWAERNRPADAADVLQCLVCARQRPVERRLKERVKRIPGGQTSGTSLISANADAFLSYGLEESLIAPVCGACGEAFTKGLNHVLALDDAVRLGDVVFTAWTRQESDFNFMGVAARPEDFAAQLDVWSKYAPPELDEEQLYAVALSAAGARAAVRSWHTTTVGNAVRNAVRWYERQRIVGAGGEQPWADAPRLGLRSLSSATVRDLRALPSTVPRSLLHGFLTGEPLPLDLLMRAIHRVQADRDVRRNQAALIKLVLRSQRDAPEEDTLMALHADARSDAYHCGRLLAELENAQRSAIRGVNATIVDRYFRKASTAPRVVFGPLIGGAQAHLAKLERDNRPAYLAIQQRIEEIMERLPDRFPDTLGPREQGEFVLGYYHQRAENRAAMQQARAARAAS